MDTEPTDERADTWTPITRAGEVRYEHDAQGCVVLRQETRLPQKPDTGRSTWHATTGLPM
ncbi:hypothetical protein [Streptomyces sp. NPDC086989]|uniref:hypothetical protein n=1 Tax=Streptomyces sp. NPDC086989 TaxID=3365764 RepID=UPI003826A9F6